MTVDEAIKIVRESDAWIGHTMGDSILVDGIISIDQLEALAFLLRNGAIDDW